MSVPIAFSSGQESKSFEVRMARPVCPEIEQNQQELRIDDYLKAYTTTGRPPQPFQPGISAPGVVPFEPRKWTPITSMEELPTSQAFHNLKNEGTAAAATGDSEYHSITFDVRYSGFSFEVSFLLLSRSPVLMSILGTTMLRLLQRPTTSTIKHSF